MSMSRINQAKGVWKDSWHNQVFFYNGYQADGTLFFNDSQWAEIRQKFESGMSFQFINNTYNQPLTGELYLKTTNLAPQYAETNTLPVAGNNTVLNLNTVIGDVFPNPFPSTSGFSINNQAASEMRIITSNSGIELKLVFSDSTEYLLPSTSFYYGAEMFRVIKMRSSENQHYFEISSSTAAAFKAAHPQLAVGDSFSAYTSGLDVLGNTLTPYQSPTYTVREIFYISGNPRAIHFNEVVPPEKRSEYRNNIQLKATTDTAKSQTIVSVGSTPAESQIVVPSNLTLSPLSINEGRPINTVVGLLSATDPGDQLTYSITSGGTQFNLLGNQLRSSMVFDYEQANTYHVNICVTDSSGAKAWKDFYVNINYVNYPPTSIAISNNQISRDASPGSHVADITGVDPDNNIIAFHIGGGNNDGLRFQIYEGNKLRLAPSTILTNIDKSILTVMLTAQDAGGEVFSKTFSIYITEPVVVPPPNTAPTHISLSSQSILENAPLRAHIADLSAIDAENNVVSYSITGGAHASLFEIYEGSKLRLAPNVLINFEALPNLAVNITATDAGGLSFQRSVIISVQDDPNETSNLPAFQPGYWNNESGAPSGAFPVPLAPVVTTPGSGSTPSSGSIPNFHWFSIPDSPRVRATVDLWPGDPRIHAPVVLAADNASMTELAPQSVVKAEIDFTDPVTLQPGVRLQKFFKIEGPAYAFQAIEVVAKSAWDWPEDGSIGWDMLQSL